MREGGDRIFRRTEHSVVLNIPPLPQVENCLTKRDCKHNLSDPPCKDDNARFTTLHLKAISGEV